MTRSWTLGMRIAVGFVLAVTFAALGALVAVRAVRALQHSSEQMTLEAEELIQASELEALTERELSQALAFLVTGDERYARNLQEASQAASRLASQLVAHARNDDVRRLLAAIDTAEKAVEARLRAMTTRDGQAREAPLDMARFRAQLESELRPEMDALRRALVAFKEHERLGLAAEKAGFARTVQRAQPLVVLAALAAMLLGGAAAAFVTRGVTRDIGAAIQDVQSSSAELQASANQQATASKEQAAATNETTTTIKELVATARQIAESARRVAQIAEQTAGAARRGGETVQRAEHALGGIKQQVDLVVEHMLALGKKSQQIGGIVEIVGELAEQTNILAINASIEAAGAGESGKRFAVVADEIRKLADRVSGSTKDIHRLVDDVRAAVNTTVMATEQGAKAVELGIREVGQMSASFGDIVGMVETTTEAAREIELSTRQQTTAVEQVNVAMSDVAQAAKETEVMSGQTLQTASQLATLSRSLSRMIRREAA